MRNTRLGPTHLHVILSNAAKRDRRLLCTLAPALAFEAPETSQGHC